MSPKANQFVNWVVKGECGHICILVGYRDRFADWVYCDSCKKEVDVVSAPPLGLLGK